MCLFDDHRAQNHRMFELFELIENGDTEAMRAALEQNSRLAVEEDGTNQLIHSAARQGKLKAMAASPEKTFRQAEQLIDQRSSVSYNAAAELLASLREALAKTPQAGLAEQYALQLHQKHPTFRLLTAALRNQGLLPEQ